jgi:hypothetical protein
VYVVVVGLVLLWAVMSRVRTYVEEREGVVPNKVLSIKTKCAEKRGGLGPDDESACSPKVMRLLDYCHEEVGLKSGDETQKPAAFDLVHLLMTVRHGDRSAIHSMPNSLGSEDAEEANARPLEPWQYSTDGLNHPVHGNEFIDLRALHHVPSLTKFELVSIEPEEHEHEEHSHRDNNEAHADPEAEHQELPPVRPLPPALDPESIFNVPDYDLAPGQLTSRGFMQEVNLGHYLSRQYSSYLEGRVQHPTNVYVRTTNYPRTIQSVAGLLLGLLPDIGGPDHPIKLLSYVAETSEVMHGIGLRLSSKGVSKASPGDKETAGGCPKSVTFAKEQKRSYKLDSRVADTIDELFGTRASTRFVTDLADASLPAVCHNRPLPCSMDDKRGCLGEHELGELMEEADRAFCARYTGEQGGEVATKLSIYPFLAEIVEALQEAAHMDTLWLRHDAEYARRKKEGDRTLELDMFENVLKVMMNPETQAGPKSSTSDEEHEIQFQRGEGTSAHVFMGHDTVIAPVLAGLGIYKDELCGWPPYASRIVFELLRPEGAVQSMENEKEVSYHARVIYNGKDLTHQIERCKGSTPCPLEAIHATVQSLLQPTGSLEKACAL